MFAITDRQNVFYDPKYVKKKTKKNSKVIFFNLYCFDSCLIFL